MHSKLINVRMDGLYDPAIVSHACLYGGYAYVCCNFRILRVLWFCLVCFIKNCNIMADFDNRYADR